MSKPVDSFVFPRSRYYGSFSPQQLAFNANLQEFAHRASLITALQTGGNLTSDEAYQMLESLWQQLARSKKGLQVGEVPPPLAS